MSADTFVAYLHSNEVTTSFSHSLFDMVGYDMTQGPHSIKQWARINCGAMGIPGARNQACSAFLKTDAEWLFFIDTDMGFEPFALEGLRKFADPVERPIIGALCFAWRQKSTDGFNGFRCTPLPTIMDWVQHPDGHYRMTGRQHYPVNSLVECSATGAAMLLIHRSVIEKLAAANGPTWFDMLPDPDPTKGAAGEDISFFIRTRELGIPLHVHTGVRTTHYKHLWVSESDFWEQHSAPPATERVDVIVPVLHRPQNVKPFMDSLRASTGLAKVFAVCEEDDDEEAAAWIEHGAEVLTFPGTHTFAEKVNAAYTLSGQLENRVEWGDNGRPNGLRDLAPWLLLVGDDVKFRPGWLDEAQDVARRYALDVVGTNDMMNERVLRGEHANHPMIRRSYIDELGASWDGPGVVCHEGYGHWFVDDEIVTVAKQRNIFGVALGARIEHLHPLAGTAPMDDCYAEGSKHVDADRKLFERRSKQHLRQLAAVG